MEEEPRQTQRRSFTDKIIDSIFKMKSYQLYLILIVLLGLTFRIVAAINLSVSGDDMHHVTHAINFLRADRLITYDQSSGLWHAFTSMAYNLLGVGQFSSRLASVVFGTSTIMVVFLLVKEFFKSNKIALFSAFLLAISPLNIIQTVAEMDVMAMFFSLGSMLFFVRGLKSQKYFNYIIGGLFLGLGIYTKVYPLLFVPSFFLYFIYFHRKRFKDKETIKSAKKFLVFLVIAALFAVPALTHNYLLYKDKGFLDLQFTRITGLGKNISEQYYGWDHQFNAKNDWQGLLKADGLYGLTRPRLLISLSAFYNTDPVNLYLGSIGLIFILFSRRYRDYGIFFLFSVLFITPYLSANILMGKHFLFFNILLIPAGGFFINKLVEVTKKLTKRDASKIFVIILLASSIFILGQSHGPHSYYDKSHISEAIEYKNTEIPTENVLLVGDSRIYRGRLNWMLYGRPYFEGANFIQALNSQDQLGGVAIPTEVYYYECVIDDCGWGGDQVKGEFNESMESLTDFFKSNGQFVIEFKDPPKESMFFPLSRNKKISQVAIYKATIPIKPEILAIASQPKNWFLYDIGYQPKEKQFDYYQAHGFFDKLLDKTAHWIVKLAILLAIISPIYLIYHTFKK